MHICVFSLLIYKMYLYLHDSVERNLHYVTVKFKIQIYICIALLEIASIRFSTVDLEDYGSARVNANRVLTNQST
jgi:hypothetical protein